MHVGVETKLERCRMMIDTFGTAPAFKGVSLPDCAVGTHVHYLGLKKKDP